MSGRLDASDKGIYIRVEDEPAPRVGVLSKSSRHAVAAVQSVEDGRGSAVYAEGHSTLDAVPAVLVRGHGELLRIERWNGTRYVPSATIAEDGTLDVEDITVQGQAIEGAGPLEIADVGGLETALAAKQPLDSDLTTFAGLTPSNDDFAQRKAGAWTNRTPAQAASDLAPFIGGSTVSFARARTTSGNITLPNTSGSWALLAGISELSIPAAVGDEVEVSWTAMRNANATAFLDIAVVTGGGPTVQRYMTTGTSTPPTEGDPSFYIDAAFIGTSGPRSFTAVSGDIDSGNIRLRVAVKAGGTGTLFASTDYPFYWQVKVFPQ